MNENVKITIADGGIETALTERLGQNLPEFAAFVLLDTADGRTALHEYFRPFIEAAVTRDLPLVLDTPTWRANSEWGSQLGYDADKLARINADAVALVRACIDEVVPDEQHIAGITVNGCIGPRYDDYVPSERMSADEAEQYHAPQVRALADAGADRVTSVTTLDADEGIGVVRAAVGARIPAAVSFAVGADGRLADGSTIAESIAAVDSATDGVALGFLVNCAHPSEAAAGLKLAEGAAEHDRIVGFRLNAARHGEDGAGDNAETFAALELELRDLAAQATVFGGCCGTDVPHIVALGDAAESAERG